MIDGNDNIQYIVKNNLRLFNHCDVFMPFQLKVE